MSFQLEETQLNPGPVVPLKAQSRFGVWTVEETGSTVRLRNITGPAEVTSQLRQSVAALVASLAIAAALFGAASQVDLAFAVASGLMGGLFLVSAFLSVLSFQRARNRRDDQAHLLEATATQARGGLEPRGFWRQYQVSHRTAAAADVRAVKLAVHRDPRRFNARANVLVTVELADGDGLRGPEGSAPDGEWLELRASLWPLAVALGHRLGKPVEVEYSWSNQRFVRPAPQV